MRWSRGTRAGLLIAAVVIACAPALNGTWVYDDWATAEHPAQDDWHDLRAVLGRDSSAYMFGSSVSPLGVTYRPLSMASLIAVRAAAPQASWPHHLVSLALHLACALGLCAAVARLRGVSGSPVPWLLAGVFALHPVTIEAYAWINGRSDVLAGAWLAALACSLPWDGGPARARRVAMSAVGAAAAILSKEPAIAGVLALCAAALLPERGGLRRTRFSAALPVAAALGGASAALLARALVTQGRISGAQVLFSDPELLPAYASSLALALEHLVLPLPRSMLCLAFELGHARALDWIVLAGLGALVVALVARGRLRPAVLIGGALVSLLPVLAVRQLVWLGFDRYLYLPLFLLCLACADLRVARLSSGARRLALRASFACLPLLGAASFVSARAYASQSAWLASLVASRPDDPSGYIMAAAWFLRRHDIARAREAVRRAPRSGLPPPLSHDLAEQLLRVGLRDEALALVDDTLRAHPRAAIARFDGLIARTLQGRFDEAYALARSLATEPAMCAPARAWLAGWLTRSDLPAGERPELERLLDELHCPEVRR